MAEVITENTIRVLDHGFVRLDDAMASDLSVVNGARVSFARHKTEMDEPDEGLMRLVMPMGAYTEFYWTVNARSLMNFVSLRAAETAQREIRRYADACERFLAEKMPVTHAAFVANDRVAP